MASLVHLLHGMVTSSLPGYPHHVFNECHIYAAVTLLIYFGDKMTGADHRGKGEGECLVKVGWTEWV